MSKYVEVRGVKIGEGVPKICVPIIGKTKEEILAAARSFEDVALDVVEWRVDWFEGVFDFAQVEDVLKDLRPALGETPILFTFRTSKEGGEKAIEADAYAELNKKAAATGLVDLVDVEAFTGDEVVKDIIEGAHAHGVKVVAYVTEDRKGNGLILSNPIRVNTTLANLDGVSAHGVIDRDKEIAVAEEYRQKMRTKCPSVEQNVGNLSGGNQQKVLLAKWMFAGPDVLILDEPTRGIDVGAKYEIYCIINDLVAAGKSVIMISSELPEVLGMSDRIYVMNEGRIVGELDAAEASQEVIMGRILSSSKGE